MLTVFRQINNERKRIWSTGYHCKSLPENRDEQKIQKHFSICRLSHSCWETTSHTRLVSCGQWNPPLTTTKQTAVFMDVKYVKYRTDTGHWPSASRSTGKRTRSPTEPSQGQGDHRYCFIPKWCCGFTGCFMNLFFHYPCISGSCSQNYLWPCAFFMPISYSSKC